jgi:hypothetical protein
VDDPNPWCEALGIPVPRLEEACRRADANTYSLLIVALLERGAPLSLAEVARRFEEAGIATAERALAALKRCKPGRPPIYREGDLYAVDPHDQETDLWAFRLGLRPPATPSLRVVRPAPEPLPEPGAPLRPELLVEAWQGGVPADWSAQRIAVCVLDAHGGALRPEEALALVEARGGAGRLSVESAQFWRQGAPVRLREDGRWALDGAHPAVRAARRALHARVAMLRRQAASRPDPAVLAAQRLHSERRRQARADALARMRRVLLHAFPVRQPEALVLLDVERRELATFLGDEIATVQERLAPYEILAAVEVRGLLRALGIDPGARRLAELGPPQKTLQLNRSGRTLRITTELLVTSSCQLHRPFAEGERLRALSRGGEHGKLRRRLEADAKALFAYYQYGRLHGAVRLRWGFLDEWIPAPWVHRDEPTLHHLMEQAHARRAPLEVVTGSAPGWRDPWARARRAHVLKEPPPGWRMRLVDEWGGGIDLRDVQAARLV